MTVALPLAARSAEDYQRALLASFPPGDAFPRDVTTLRAAYVGAMADGLSRAEAAAFEIVLRELDPRTATFMFPEWVSLTGVAVQPQQAQTAALIMARIQNLGSQAVGYFVTIAAAIGFTIQIVEHTPRRYGKAKMGQQYGGPPWAFVFDVIAPTTTVFRRQYGVAKMGQPYSSWGNAALVTLINNYKPAHLLARFIYR